MVRDRTRCVSRPIRAIRSSAQENHVFKTVDLDGPAKAIPDFSLPSLSL